MLREISIADGASALAKEIDVDGLFERAQAAAHGAYAPYSGLKVGAAVLTSDGTTITACNFENGSYGLTICAERAAVFRAVSEGHHDLAAVAVATNNDRIPRWPAVAHVSRCSRSSTPTTSFWWSIQKSMSFACRG
jgi:cytidine deaminase